jgi:hypothetical protein
MLKTQTFNLMVFLVEGFYFVIGSSKVRGFVATINFLSEYLVENNSEEIVE